MRHVELGSFPDYGPHPEMNKLYAGFLQAGSEAIAMPENAHDHTLRVAAYAGALAMADHRSKETEDALSVAAKHITPLDITTSLARLQLQVPSWPDLMIALAPLHPTISKYSDLTNLSRSEQRTKRAGRLNSLREYLYSIGYKIEAQNMSSVVPAVAGHLAQKMRSRECPTESTQIQDGVFLRAVEGKKDIAPLVLPAHIWPYYYKLEAGIPMDADATKIREKLKVSNTRHAELIGASDQYLQEALRRPGNNENTQLTLWAALVTRARIDSRADTAARKMQPQVAKQLREYLANNVLRRAAVGMCTTAELQCILDGLHGPSGLSLFGKKSLGLLAKTLHYYISHAIPDKATNVSSEANIGIAETRLRTKLLETGMATPEAEQAIEKRRRTPEGLLIYGATSGKIDSSHEKVGRGV